MKSPTDIIDEKLKCIRLSGLTNLSVNIYREALVSDYKTFLNTRYCIRRLFRVCFIEIILRSVLCEDLVNLILAYLHSKNFENNLMEYVTLTSN
jgi:hypothetical protein